MTTDNLAEDGKVVGSAAMAVILDYAEVFNQAITLLISLCTLVYVANRAWQSIRHSFLPLKRKGRRR